MGNSGLIKKTKIYLIGNLSSKIISFILIPLYALYLNPVDLGYFEYSQTIVGFIIPLLLLAIWEALLKFLLIKNKSKDRIITTTFIFAIVANIIFIGFTAIMYSLDIFNLDYIQLTIIMVVINSFCCLWQYVTRGLGENKLYTKAGIIGVIINLLVTIITLIILKLGVYSLYISYILSNITIIFIIEKKLKILKSIKLKNFELKTLKRMLVFSGPLVLNLVSAWGIAGFGTIIINKHLGAEANGIYSFSNKFSIIITTLGSVISMALIEESIIKSKDDDISEYFSLVINKLFKIFNGIILLMVPVINIFFIFLKNSEYYESKKYFSILILYALFTTLATNIGTIFQAIDRTKYIFLTTMIGSIVTVILGFITINKFGIFGISFSTISGAIIMVLARYVYVRRNINLKLEILNWIALIIFYIIVSLISFRVNIIMNIIIFISIVVILGLINKSDLYLIKKKITDIR